MSTPVPTNAASTVAVAASAAASAAANDRYHAAFTALSCLVFNVPTLRPAQSFALRFMFQNPRCGGTVLLVDRTGGGKSHVMRASGVFIRGIILVCAPLLALAADLYPKFMVRSLHSTHVMKGGHGIMMKMN